MTEPTAAPAAPTTPAKTKSGGPNYILIAIAIGVIFINVIGMATGQIGNFFQMAKMNTGPILALVAFYFLYKASK